MSCQVILVLTLYFETLCDANKKILLRLKLTCFYFNKFVVPIKLFFFILVEIVVPINYFSILVKTVVPNNICASVDPKISQYELCQ